MYDEMSSSEGLLSHSSSPSFTSEEKLEIPRRRNAQVLPKTTYILIALLVLSLIANVVVVVILNAAISMANGLLGDETRNCKPQTKLYSPAQDALEYKVTKFESSIYGGETEYQGPPTEYNNRLWKQTYSHMNTHITEEEAKQLPNKTMPEPPYEGSGYLIVLNIFHDLHCIDSLRLALYYFLDDQWNSTYNPYTLFEHLDDALWAKGGRDLSIMHLDHCIDALRQSTQCNGDITPNVYQWSEKWGEVRAWATVVHECRNFDNIVDWAKSHYSRLPFAFGDGPAVGKCAWDDPWTCLLD
ncbi:hypothetical protein BDZ45DRAFT_732120 [Acephala macrosclerotiorum]|nr:hypothetical protein BDZ45DRAFT_732120 [Acephala macrosclerotiorum]